MKVKINKDSTAYKILSVVEEEINKQLNINITSGSQKKHVMYGKVMFIKFCLKYVFTPEYMIASYLNLDHATVLSHKRKNVYNPHYFPKNLEIDYDIIERNIFLRCKENLINLPEKKIFSKDTLKSLRDNNENFKKEVAILKRKNLKLVNSKENYRSKLTYYRKINKELKEKIDNLEFALKNLK